MVRTVRRGVVLVIAAGAVAAVLAACTSSVSGSASPGDDVGAVATSPAASGRPEGFVEPPELSVGNVVEAHRIAAVTSLVQTSFPDRTESCFPSGPVVLAEDLAAAYFAGDRVAPVLEEYGFVAAWGQCQQSASGGSTLTLTIELSDPESARRAAAELSVPDPAQPGVGQTVSLPGTGLPAQLSPVTGGEGEEVVQAWVSVGRMLAYVFHEDAPGQAVAGADRVMADQTGLLAGFVPTPQAAVAGLLTDPLGLQSLALAPPGELTLTSGPYDLEGYLRLALDPFREREVLGANGFVGAYAKHSTDGDLSYAVNLYAFPSSAQTNAVYEAFAELESAAFGGTTFVLPSIPQAPCFVFGRDGVGGQSFYQRCYVGYGSYLVGIDVGGLGAAEDTTEMDRLLPAQRDLIDG